MVNLIAPKTFLRSGEGVIATYSFTDIASGTGITDLYLGRAINAVYSISNKTYYADPKYTYGDAVHASYTKVLDLDFNALVNRPMIIQGNSVINIPIRMVSTGGGSLATTVYVVAIVRKWDGTTETDLVTSSNSGADLGATAGTYYRMNGLSVTIPLTTFKRGEYIRLTIECWVRSDQAGSYFDIGHDPMDRVDATYWTSTTVGTRAVFQLPVKIDI